MYVYLKYIYKEAHYLDTRSEKTDYIIQKPEHWTIQRGLKSCCTSSNYITLYNYDYRQKKYLQKESEMHLSRSSDKGIVIPLSSLFTESASSRT